MSAVAHTYRGYCDNHAHNIVKDGLPWLEKIAVPGRAIAIMSAEDDTVATPEMQLWFLNRLQGSVLLKADNGWDHTHHYTEANQRRMLGFLKTGR